MSRTFRRSLSASCLAVCLLLGGCVARSGQVLPDDGRLRLTVTVGMVADLVREVGGDRVQVLQLMGSGVDPHLYKPTRDDVRHILRADAVFFNGWMLEGKMGSVLRRFSSTKPTLAVAEQLALPELESDAAHAGHPDPHVWMDVQLWSQAVDVVERELSRLEPAYADEFAVRAAGLRARLERLHAYGQEIMSGVPESRRVLVTSHDAFRYFGLAYGLEVQAVQGLSTESEAGLRRINELVDLLVQRQVTAVFIESSVPQESIQSLLHGAASRGQAVSIGGELYSDAMGPEGTYTGTYIGMMDHNLTTIARALGSRSVPDGGYRDFAAAGARDLHTADRGSGSHP
jgi:manganese/zinc/iron transport system substrate-binding protein